MSISFRYAICPRFLVIYIILTEEVTVNFCPYIATGTAVENLLCKFT